MSDEKFHALNKTLARRGLQQFQSRAAFDNFRKKTRERQRQAKPPLFSMETARKMSGKRHHNEVLASLVALYIVARTLQGKSSESLLSLKLHGFASGSLTVSQLKRFLDFRTPKVQLATTVEQSRAAAFLQAHFVKGRQATWIFIPATGFTFQCQYVCVVQVKRLWPTWQLRSAFGNC